MLSRIIAWALAHRFVVLLFWTGIAVAGVLAQTAFTRGLTAGDASLMALMDYTRLPMAALAGLLIFHELLDIWTMIGAAIVIGSTIFITVREAMLAKKRAPPLPD